MSLLNIVSKTPKDDYLEQTETLENVGHIREFLLAYKFITTDILAC